MAFRNYSGNPDHNIDDYILGFVPENTPFDRFKPDPIILDFHTAALTSLFGGKHVLAFRYIHEHFGIKNVGVTAIGNFSNGFFHRHEFRGQIGSDSITVRLHPGAKTADIVCKSDYADLKSRFNGRFVLRTLEPPFEHKKISLVDRALLRTFYKSYVRAFVPPQDFLSGASPH